MPKVELMGLPGKFGGMEALENEPPVSWLIHNWLAARELSCLYGKGGTFKSYIALAWSLQLAAQLIPVPVLYIAAEGTSGLRSRVDAWMTARQPKQDILKHWHYYNANVHMDQDNDRGMWVAALRRYMRTVQRDGVLGGAPQLVVVDTLARNFAGDENIAKDMGQFVEGCEYMRRELGCAVLVIHHMGLRTNRERGTAALRNATFAMFQTSDGRYNSNGGGSIKLSCDRMKDAPRPDEVRVQFDTVALSTGEHGDVYRMSQAMRKWPPKKGDKPSKEVIDL